VYLEDAGVEALVMQVNSSSLWKEPPMPPGGRQKTLTDGTYNGRAMQGNSYTKGNIPGPRPKRGEK